VQVDWLVAFVYRCGSTELCVVELSYNIIEEAE